MIETILTLKKTERLTDTVCRLTLSGNVPTFQAGQFVHIAVPGFTLRRPFCITAGNNREVIVVFSVVGAGTLALSKLSAGIKLNCILPIGNGFPIAPTAKRIMVLGGGLGVAPLLPVLSQSKAEACALLGFSTKSQVIEEKEFLQRTKNVRFATDDGSYGYRGRVTEIVPDIIKDFRPDAVYVCGPTPMLRVAQTLDFGCPAYVSLEARMGCGVGACLVCTCPVKHGETVNNVRVCVDGPVFLLKDVVL